MEALDALPRVGTVTHLLVVAHHAGKRLGEREPHSLRALLEDVVLVLVSVVGHISVEHDGVDSVPILHDVVEGVLEVIVVVWGVIIYVRVTHDGHGRDKRAIRSYGDGRGVRHGLERAALLACGGAIRCPNCRECRCRCARDGSCLEKLPSRKTHVCPLLVQIP